MREIKFRLWCNHPQKYYDQSFAIINGKPYYEANPRNKDYVTCDINGQKETFYSDWAKFMPLFDCVLEQYTGLKDKNGIEIYEGDILELEYPLNYGFAGIHERKIIVKIAFQSVCFWFEGGGYTDRNWPNYNNYKIIGNINQNPELLNE